MQAKISTRGKNTPPSPIRKLVPYAMRAKSEGVKVYHLNIGQPDIETPKPFLDAIHSYPSKVVKYGNSEGMPEYIDRLIQYYHSVGIELEKDEIVITNGGSEAIIFAMLVTGDTNDNFIIFEPFYTNYNGYSVMADVNLKPITTRPENGYHPPAVETIESQIDMKTKGIFICSPNNPTGAVLTREEIEMVADIAKRHNLFVISDEVYREFIYEGEHTSIMDVEGLEDRAVLLDSVSKRFSLCGARVGCICSKNKDLMKAVLRFGQARLCPPTIEQYGAGAILSSLEGSYFNDVIGEYKQRRDIAYEELMKIDGVVCKKPTGAFYIMAKLPIPDTDDFAKWLLSEYRYNGETTMIAPGAGFYASKDTGQSEVRIAYVLKEEDLRKAIKIIAEGLEEYKAI